MAGVETDRQPPALPDRAENIAQVLEPVTDGSPLTRGGLQQDAHASRLGHPKSFVQAGRGARDAGGFSLASVRAGMEDEVADAEGMAPKNLVGQRRNRLPAKFL